MARDDHLMVLTTLTAAINNRLMGEDGKKDTLIEGLGVDTLVSGKGNDLLNGGEYDLDIYVFNSGDGQDMIQDISRNSGLARQSIHRIWMC